MSLQGYPVRFGLDEFMTASCPEPLSRLGWMELRDMDKYELDRSIRYVERHLGESILGGGLVSKGRVHWFGMLWSMRQLRKALPRYTKLYGAICVYELPLFVIDRCAGNTHSKPAGKVGVK